MRPLLSHLRAARRAIVLYALLLSSGWLLGEVLREFTIPEMRPMNEPTIRRIVMGAFLVYVIATALPFVPGAEIGFALLLMFGGKVAPLVYAGMVCALVVSYGIARMVPSPSLSGGLGFLAGMSGLLGFWPYLAVVMCAAAPIPLFFLLT